MTAAYYPSPRERLADRLLWLATSEEEDTVTLIRLSSFAEAQSLLTPENLWDYIYEVMEEQVFFLDPDADLTPQASQEEIAELGVQLALKGISDSWSSPFDSRLQRLVDFDSPQADAAEEFLVAGPAPDWRDYMSTARNSTGFGDWQSIPLIPGVFLSSEPQPGLPATLLLGNEDDFGDEEATINASIRETGPMRVWEIDGPADWVRLVDAAPAEATTSRDGYWGANETGWRWEIPDWEAVAEEFDAVHVTVNGYLDTSCVPLETGSGARTMFVGWGPGITVWLTPPKISWGPAFRVRRVDSALWV
ncbi:hypothetical protein J4H92_04320 [Leucobacter weissii]|uniref:Uncharacterized protein n=1 Tax=Leucobacter weissii TaxID=1983706 RepID=A0A939MHS0_9MICO|nr:hypothetical protein [Leucobacter weissii]MBO1901173.1 hypothetical protein [Leucobacter weissii]